MRRRSSPRRIRRGARHRLSRAARCALSPIENALHWLQHYRFDGLRLDAVHAIVEPGEPPILQELSRAVGDFAAADRPARSIWCWRTTTIARACSIRAPIRRSGKYRAQWNDDYHHAWHVLLTGERKGYYQDYAATRAGISRARLRSGFAYQGEASAHRSGRAARRALRRACRRRRSSIFCRTTTRSATGRSAIA